jgi:simple sugar transport system permease protein
MDLITQILPYAMAYTAPLLITSLGGLYSERSGVVNIGLEGLMVMGGFGAAFAISSLQPALGPWAVWIGLAAGTLIGALFSLLHSFASISLNANQVISGTAINMIAGAVTVFFARKITGSGNIQIIAGLPRFEVPLLEDIPLLGPLLFRNAYASTWLILVILFCSWYLLYRTPFGLRLRACGEHPQAADSAGIDVRRIRYIAVTISGALAGLGGATILATYSGQFNGSVGGMGFLALAALIFGQWKPFGILFATLFFGFAATVANVSQVIPEFAAVPGVILKTFPYVITLVALVLFSKSSQAPRAAGEPFEHGK